MVASPWESYEMHVFFGSSQSIREGTLEEKGTYWWTAICDRWNAIRAAVFGTGHPNVQVVNVHQPSTSPSLAYVNKISTTDGSMQPFFRMTLDGTNTDGNACSMHWFILMGECKTCTCSLGLVQVESFGELTEDITEDDKCEDWLVKATSMTTSFFSHDRMAVMLKKSSCDS